MARCTPYNSVIQESCRCEMCAPEPTCSGQSAIWVKASAAAACRPGIALVQTPPDANGSYGQTWLRWSCFFSQLACPVPCLARSSHISQKASSLGKTKTLPAPTLRDGDTPHGTSTVGQPRSLSRTYTPCTCLVCLRNPGMVCDATVDSAAKGTGRDTATGVASPCLYRRPVSAAHRR